MPTASRMPISRVSPVAETSMMFVMPMPPTSSETPAIAPSKAVRAPSASTEVHVRAVSGLLAAPPGRKIRRRNAIFRQVSAATPESYVFSAS